MLKTDTDSRETSARFNLTGVGMSVIRNQGQMTRRNVMKIGLAGGISLYLSTGATPGLARSEQKISESRYQDGARKAEFRIDGIDKVTGGKVFARDIRASDMPGWPVTQAHALILRLPLADRTYLGLDLTSVPQDAFPDRIVEAKDLQRDGIDFPAFYTKNMLLPIGETPPILGQAVAILIFDDYARYHRAKRALQFRSNIFRFGAVEPDPVYDPWDAFRFVRVAGKERDTFNQIQDGVIKPQSFKRGEAVWPSPRPDGHIGERGMAHAMSIQAMMDAAPHDVLVLERRYKTASNDAVAMETESANCWYDPAAGAVHMVVSVQNPQDALLSAASMLKDSAFRVRSIHMHPTHTVGYGSKDLSNHACYALAAALYGAGTPVRTALDRHEHFQAALKRHPFDVKYRIAIDRTTGSFRALQSRIEANGGGRPSFSSVVVQESTAQSAGIYDVPHVDLIGTARRTKALDASAIRGFGNLQTMSGLEMLVDEAANILGQDAIDLRLRNVLRTGRRNAQGGVPSGRVRIVDVLERARAHPLWRERAQRKEDFESTHPGSLFGIGFACVQKNFGTGAEAGFAKVELAQDGKIVIHHCGVEMGTGFSTTQAHVCVEWFGRPADTVVTGVTDWRDIVVESTGNAFANTQSFEDEGKKSDIWSPHYVSSTGATNTAYYFTHATKQAARIIAEYGLWPAALAIWGVGQANSQGATEKLSFAEATWTVEGLTARGMDPIAWPVLVKKAFSDGLVTGAAVHYFNRWQWAEADYTLLGQQIRLPLDAVSIRLGEGMKDGSSTPHHYTRLVRRNVHYPPVQRYQGGPTLTSAAAALVALTVDRASGEVSILQHHTIVECGRVMMPKLAEGQVRGATAMGIGFALYEELPTGADGPGNGEWNLDRYRVPRLSDVAPWTQSVEFIPPLSATDPPKGFAEAAIIPIAPAIGNAIAHACGKRLLEFPMTPKRIKEALS